MIYFRHISNTLMFFCVGCIILGSISNTVFASDQSIKFAVISDHRTDYEGLDIALEFIASQNVDFLIVAGDFSPIAITYPDHYSKWGFEVRDDVHPESQNLILVLGNHDSPPSGNEFFRTNIAPYYPKNGPASSPHGTIFSFDAEDIHFVITNQYWNYRKGGYTQEQLNWIDADLKASEKTYKFVFGHEPAYPLGRHVGDSLDINIDMRDEFWSILNENQVQAYFCGHSHNLSVIRDNGVYQIDSGEVTSTRLHVVIVEIDEKIAIARLYATEGTIPEVSDDDNIYNSLLDDFDGDDEAYTVLFSVVIGDESESGWGCFIENIVY